MILLKQLVQVARVGIAHSVWNLFNAHLSADKHIFHRFQPAFLDVLFEILSKIPFKETACISGGKVKLFSYNIQFQEFGLVDMQPDIF